MVIDYCDTEDYTNISIDFTEDDCKKITLELTNQLQQMLKMIWAREFRKDKVYAKQKLIDKSGGDGDWKNGKFVFTISTPGQLCH